MSLSILHVFSPLVGLIPETAAPPKNISMIHKVIWTSIGLFIYLICCQIPLYGVARSQGTDSFYWIRVMLASNKGTLMELGISPQISASMIMQLLYGLRILNIDMNFKYDRMLFERTTKLLGILMALCEAIAYTYSGMYGEISQLGHFTAMIIIFQLTFSGIIIMLIDDMLQIGWGLGSGISLFIATNICENIIWKSLSPITQNSESGIEFEGSIINAIHLMIQKLSFSNLYKAFVRQSAPNLNNLIATVLIFFIVIYLQGFKMKIRLLSKRQKGSFSELPIKLFYTSNIPIIMQSYLISNVYILSQLLHQRFGFLTIVKILGSWKQEGRNYIPIGGIAYYISPPNSFFAIFYEPIHFICYVVFMCTCCGLMARYWIEISGENTNSIVKKLRENQMTISGLRDESMQYYLNKFIPTAAILGGIIIGLITIIADMLGAIGSGTGILLSVTIIYGYFEKIKKNNIDLEL